ncbi:LysR substrate-binding domain-containing protein [Nisaea acidiphila]|uniref:LysR substrate-binding domain-containing protein n=1 Tax=Nisaea acidiphila TaxID=1862145 RepID=A0A9J7B0D9_9PROT|nr:LysR substrate-binding domain-containing protein [Nisaea acidiphila]UUX51948.1 LysR substrate-binding domain-containing protein [Nisaea acidiphila]
MDTRQMRYFVALAETLHFGRAAECMNMTQPPFSRQIANLERDLGVRLVERNSRQVSLTPAGQRFLKDSRAVLAQFEAACRDARLVAEGQKGEVQLGFMMHAAHRIVPRIVSGYTALRPDVRVSLSETTPAEIEAKLLNRELDAGITFSGRTLPQLESVPVVTDRLCLVTPLSHPLAELEMVGPRDLRDADLIATPSGISETLRRAVSDYFAADGIVPRFRFEPQLQNTILRLVAAGLGVALVPESICDGQLSDIVARPLRNAPRLEVVLKVRRESDNPAVVPLVELIRRESFSGAPE